MIRKGTYVLVITLDADKDIPVGALGTLHFCKGSYCYVGSAMGGLDQRVSRHLSREKRVKWHVDRLTMAADSVRAYISYPDFIDECELARLAEASGMVPACKGFGSSDRDCHTHLFAVTEGSLERFLQRTRMEEFRDRTISLFLIFQ